jgi:hypothetical protein
MKLTDAIATVEPEIDFEVIVLRCNCGNPKSHAPGLPGVENRPCPTPILVNLGVVASNHQKIGSVTIS